MGFFSAAAGSSNAPAGELGKNFFFSTEAQVLGSHLPRNLFRGVQSLIKGLILTFTSTNTTQKHFC